ncbi:MAG: hypothetical protein WBW84_19460 [Acidobacteriaceae bacterium]
MKLYLTLEKGRKGLKLDEPFTPGWNDEGERLKKYPPLEQHKKAFTRNWKDARRGVTARKEYLGQAEMKLALHLLELARQRQRFTLEVSNADLQTALGVGRTAVLNARKPLVSLRIIRVEDGEMSGSWRCELLGPDGNTFPGETGSPSQPRRVRGGKYGPDLILK